MHTINPRALCVGLHLILDIEQEEYVREVGEVAGARLVVHAPSHVPFPEDEGITLHPGTITFVATTQVTAQVKMI